MVLKSSSADEDAFVIDMKRGATVVMAAAATMTAKITVKLDMSAEIACAPVADLHVATLLDLPFEVHPDALEKCQRITAVNAKELCREKDRKDRRILHSNDHSFIEKFVILARQQRVEPECVDRTYGGEDLFSQQSGAGVNGELLAVVLCDEADTYPDCYDNTRNDADGDKSELPLHGKRDHECSDKC
jgi:hypothetical protein